MNLENLNLVELNAQEVNEVDGGWIVPVLEGLALIATAAMMYHDEHCGKCNRSGWSTGTYSQGSSGSW